MYPKALILSSEKSRMLDQQAKNLFLLEDRVLVESAGRACVQVLLDQKIIDSSNKILILCGSGNNGADGLVMARVLASYGFYPKVHNFKQSRAFLNLKLRELYLKLGGQIEERNIKDELLEVLSDYDVVLDCIMGTGFKGPIGQDNLQFVNEVNKLKEKLGFKVISIDVPSFFDCDVEDTFGSQGIKSDYTLAIQTLKRIHVEPELINEVGQVFLIDVGIPVTGEFLELEVFTKNIASVTCKKAFSEGRLIHKGNRPKVLFFAGEKAGASVLGAYAALKTGASLVTIASMSEQVVSLMKPEMMFHLLDTENFSNDVRNLTAVNSTVVLGPGLGISESSFIILEEVLKACKLGSIPLVLDADAVVMLGRNFSKLEKFLPPNLVLTPHPKEFLSLCSNSGEVAEILLNRFEECREVSKKFKSSLLLKGARSLVTTECRQYVNPHIEPVLAVGGSGDTLAGMIAAVLARLDNPHEALALAVFIHGEAGKKAKEALNSSLGVLPSEIAAFIPQIVSELTSNQLEISFYQEPFLDKYDDF